MIMACLRQTYIIFLARLKNPHFSPGPESSECQLFPLHEIPFNSLSFSSMVVTLSLVWFRCFNIFLCLKSYFLHSNNVSYGVFSWLQYVEDKKAGGKPKFHYGTISKRYFHVLCRISIFLSIILKAEDQFWYY